MLISCTLVFFCDWENFISSSKFRCLTSMCNARAWYTHEIVMHKIAEKIKLRIICIEKTKQFRTLFSIFIRTQNNKTSRVKPQLLISIESCQHKARNVKIETRTFSMDRQNRRADEDVISPQSSSKSLVFQAKKNIRSSSWWNSQPEDQIAGCNLSKNRGPQFLYPIFLVYRTKYFLNCFN